MRVTVIFVAAKLGLAIILSSGSVLSVPSIHECSGFAALPASIEVREVHLLLNNQGFVRNHFGHHLSRLKRYSKARLAQLYQLRWQATEVNFKHLKTTLKMEMILRKLLKWCTKNLVHLLAYNLLRNLMWQSAQQARCALADFLAGTRQQFNQFRPNLAQATAKTIIASTLPSDVISAHLVPLRPSSQNPESLNET